jgi:nucleotide-binding universal stress UspA family protein
MYKRILIPVDGSQTSIKALNAALRLAKESEGRVRIIHVVEELLHLAGYSEMGGYSGQLTAALHDAGVKLLQDMVAIADAAGVEADTRLFDDFGVHLGESVADEAKRWAADLIVVGTHGRRGMGRMLMGSGAEQVIRLAPVHVLVVRESQAPPT